MKNNQLQIYNQEVPLYSDSFIWENRPFSFRESDDVLNSEERKEEIIAELKTDYAFMLYLKYKYIDNTRKLPFALNIPKRDRRFSIKNNDSYFYKSAIYLEYYFSGVGWKDRLKRGLLFALVGILLAQFIPIAGVRRFICNKLGLLYQFIFGVYVNPTPTPTSPIPLEVPSVPIEQPSFLFNIFQAVKAKFYTIIDLYSYPLNPKEWSLHQWIYFCIIAFNSFLFVELVAKKADIAHTLTLDVMTVVRVLGFSAVYYAIVENSIHCVAPVQHFVNFSVTSVKSAYRAVLGIKEPTGSGWSAYQTTLRLEREWAERNKYRPTGFYGCWLRFYWRTNRIFRNSVKTGDFDNTIIDMQNKYYVDRWVKLFRQNELRLYSERERIRQKEAAVKAWRDVIKERFNV